MSRIIFELIMAIAMLIIFWPFINLLYMLASPKVTVRARVISKRSLSVRYYNGLLKPYLPLSSRCGIFSRSTGYGRYFSTISLKNGKQIELQMYLERFRELNDGDEVEVIYKHKWLVSFNKCRTDDGKTIE